MLNTPQVCIQWRSLKDVTAPYLFVTLRFSSAHHLTPAQQPEEFRDTFITQEEKASTGWCPLSTHSKTSSYLQAISSSSAMLRVKTLLQVLGPAACITAPYLILQAGMEEAENSSIYWKSSNREVKGNILAPNGSLWWAAEYTEGSRM